MDVTIVSIIIAVRAVRVTIRTGSATVATTIEGVSLNRLLMLTSKLKGQEFPDNNLN